MEIKNKLTATRGEGEGDNREKKGKCHQGTCIKDPCTKTNGGGLNMGGGGWVVLGRIMGEMGIAVIKQKHFFKNT